MFTCHRRLLALVALSAAAATSALAQVPPGQDREALAHRLEAKREELGALQREVDQLTRLLGQEQVILCAIQRVEFEMAELQASGMFPAAPGETEVQRYARLEHELRKPLFVEQLDKRKIAFVNTMPIVMRANDPTWFTEGGEFPFVQNSGGAVSVEYKKYGTGMELVGQIIDANHLRVELNMHCSELDEAWKREIQGNESYALETSDLKRTLEGATGTTFIVWHPKLMRGPRKPRAATDIAWLITPQLFDAPADPLTTSIAQQGTPTAYPSTSAMRTKLRFKLVRINLDELPSHRAEHNLLQKVWGLGSEEQNLRPSFADTPQQAQQAIAALDKLVQQGVAHVLSDSVVQATLGQASCAEDVTGELTYPVAPGQTEKKKLGLFVDALATPSRDGRITLESRFSFYEAELDERAGGLPLLRVEDAYIDADILPGETCFWRGITRVIDVESTDKRGRKRKEEALTQTVMLLTPEVVPPVQAALPPASNSRR